VNPYLYRKFVLKFVPELKDLIIDYVLNNSEKNIRNFAKEKIDILI
jgi:hypothetical protein